MYVNSCIKSAIKQSFLTDFKSVEFFFVCVWRMSHFRDKIRVEDSKNFLLASRMSLNATAFPALLSSQSALLAGRQSALPLQNIHTLSRAPSQLHQFLILSVSSLGLKEKEGLLGAFWKPGCYYICNGPDSIQALIQKKRLTAEADQNEPRTFSSTRRSPLTVSSWNSTI